MRHRAGFITLSAVAVVALVGGLWWSNQLNNNQISSNKNSNNQGFSNQASTVTCKDFSELRKNVQPTRYEGMVWVPDGTFIMGSDKTYPEEAPAHQETVAGFWIDQHEVTNAEFSEFVAATAYVTLAEQHRDEPNIPESQRVPGSVVFMPMLDGKRGLLETWWQYIPGANWQHPQGPDSSIDGMENFPVVHITYDDAVAYATWKGRELPTEAQFEFAAQSSIRKDATGHHQANTWQGFFPVQNQPDDGFSDIAPVGCYAANDYGAYDLVGNVWEWTSSAYYPTHSFSQKDAFPQGFDPNQPNEAVAAIKGGSFLCAANYCMRYRPQARQAQNLGLGTSHIGFRTVINP